MGTVTTVSVGGAPVSVEGAVVTAPGASWDADRRASIRKGIRGPSGCMVVVVEKVGDPGPSGSRRIPS
jgi:hypothetical protein